MKDYQERTKSIKEKTSALKRRRIALCSAAALCVVVLVCGIMAIPMFGPDAPDLAEYKSSSYYPLLSVLHTQYATKVPDKQSAWQKIEDSFDVDDGNIDTTVPGETTAPIVDPDAGPEYQETTLNQVDGVVEGDLLKRSDTHAFYLTPRIKDMEMEYVLQVYSLDRQGWTAQPTAPIAEFTVEPQGDMRFGQYYYGWWSECKRELFLSQDATRVTLLLPCGNYYSMKYTCVVSLDVSDPTAVQECNRVYVSGWYETSRKVDDKLLVVTNYRLGSMIDYDDAKTFVPHWGVEGDMQEFAMDEVYLPNKLDECAYTAIMEFNERDLTVVDKQALLSYTNEVAVSSEHLFVTHEYKRLILPDGKTTDNWDEWTKDVEGLSFVNVPIDSRTKAMTDIVYVRYNDGLSVEGCVTVEGSIKDQYSMDEYNGMLRVAVTDKGTVYKQTSYPGLDGKPMMYDVNDNSSSASLYCIDLQSGNVVGEVRRFAPVGEDVRSVRFAENTAYVCTAVRNTDPVFAFDLSDPKHITYKDTGTIPGYSISLLPFGDCLVGIGYVENMATLKIEAYRQSESAVESVAVFAMEHCTFSFEYKAHYVDAQRGLIGLQVCQNNCWRYLLLKFDGQEFVPVYYGQFDGDVSKVRAFYAEDGVYVVSEEGMIFIDPTYDYQPVMPERVTVK